ncbi:MAG TPA: 3-hydroxyacyl-CoA dehydrogenase NAD-binding domain-containing protein, partial [Thermoleophilaceae bacterium]
MEISKVGVLGAGLMGHGIAQVSAEAGYDVVLRDIDQAFVDKGRAAIETQLRRAVEKGKKTQKDADAALAR